MDEGGSDESYGVERKKAFHFGRRGLHRERRRAKASKRRPYDRRRSCVVVKSRRNRSHSRGDLVDSEVRDDDDHKDANEEFIGYIIGYK